MKTATAKSPLRTEPYRAPDPTRLTALAVVFYCVNRKNKYPEFEAMGDALWLAHVVATDAKYGWTGTNKNPDTTSQVIPTKIYAKGGVWRISKTFRNQVMNEDRYDTMVRKPLGEQYAYVVKMCRAMVGIGTSPPKIVDQVIKLIREQRK